MRQMFRNAKAITYRDGKLNIFGFNSKGEYGFEDGFEDKKMSVSAALKEARIDNIDLPPEIGKALGEGVAHLGEFGDQVDLPGFREGLEQFVNHTLDVRAQPRDHLGAEGS